MHLRGRYTAPDGTTSVVAIAGTAEARSKVGAAAVLGNGVPVPELPKGPRYVKLAEQDADVADVLRILGQPDRWIGTTYTKPGKSWSTQSEVRRK